MRGRPRQAIGRHLGGIIDPARDDRLIRITFEEINDHLLPDPGDLDEAPARPGPGRADADETAGILILFPQPVPVELHFDPRVFVGEDLCPGGADHNGGLRPLHHRLRGLTLRAIGQIGRGKGDHHLEPGRCPFPGAVLAVPHLIVGPQHQIFGIFRLAREFVELERYPRPQPGKRPFGFGAAVRGLFFLAPDQRQRFAWGAFHVIAGIVIGFPRRQQMRKGLIRFGHQIKGGFFKVVVGVNIHPLPHPGHGMPVGDDIIGTLPR